MTGAADDRVLRTRLSDGGRAMGLELDEAQKDLLLGYVQLLSEWNRSINLSGVREPEDMIAAHLLDCLSLVPLISGTRLLDVGSGAGLPAIPVAIACPNLDVVSVDSRRRRTEFQRYAAQRLGLENLEVVCGRVETYRPELNFDTLASRAFSSLGNFARLAGVLCRPGGIMLAMKGALPESEINELTGYGFSASRVVPVEVPGLDAERCIVVMTRNSSAPNTSVK